MEIPKRKEVCNCLTCEYLLRQPMYNTCRKMKGDIYETCVNWDIANNRTPSDCPLNKPIKIRKTIREERLLKLIEELEFRKNDDEPEDEGYNLGINVGIIEIKKILREIE